jgi:tripartite ATP-independent transporter DctM subunit
MSGIATVTEVSVLAVLYALVLSALLYRDLDARRLWNAMVRTAVATGAVLLIIMASSLVGWILTVEQIPNRLTEWFLATSGSYVLAIVFMNVIMLFVETFLDMPAAILILGPVFVPLADAIGLDLVQLGVMMTLNLAIGLFTPPVGTTLYISTSIAGIKIEETVRALLPFYAEDHGS